MAKTITFEEALHNLEDCVLRLEQEDLPIDKAFSLFEDGVKNVQRCQKSLQNIETKVERLTRGSDGKLTTGTLNFHNLPTE
jgi:exodeoxyribonuclease VII small subunit